MNRPRRRLTTERWDKIWSIVDSETVDRLLFHDERSARLNRRLWEASGLRNTGEMFRALTRRAPSVPALIHRPDDYVTTVREFLGW